MHRRILALALIAAGGCGGPPLTVDADCETSADFSKYKTWSWMAGAKPSEKDVDPLSRQRIQDAIEAELPRHGLAKKDEGGDRSVNYQISVEHKIKPSNASVGVGYGWGPAHIGVSKSPPREYDEGTLILDLVDAQGKTLVWRGTAKGTVRPENSPEGKKENIRKAVAYLLEGHPPSKQKE